MTLSQARSVKVLIALGCAFCLYYWALQGIQTTGVPESRPETGQGSGDADGLQVGDSPGNDSTQPRVTLDEQRDAYAELLAEGQRQLEREKKDAEDTRGRLERRLAALALGLDELRAAESAFHAAWATLGSADENGARFTEKMAEEYLDLCQWRESLKLDVDALSERRNLLDALLCHFSREEVAATLEGLTHAIVELEGQVATLSREYRERTQQTERLAERVATSRPHGETLATAMARIEMTEAAPELEKMEPRPGDALAAECDGLLEQVREQMRRALEKEIQQRRSAGEAEVADIRGATAKSLTEHEAEQKRLDAELEAREAKVAFEESRAMIEHYLVPFIALRRTYEARAITGDEPQQIVCANIPLEKAASLTDIAETGVFQQGPGEYIRLRQYVADRVEYDIKERMLPFGQHWKVRDDQYLILARELLMKHGPAMVEASLLQP